MIIHLADVKITGNIPSENRMYQQKTTNSGKTFVYLVPRARKFKEQIIKSLKGSDVENLAKYNYEFLEVTFVFYIRPSRFLKSDCSNMTKVTEDALVEVTKIDDRKHSKVTSEKKPMPYYMTQEEVHISVLPVTRDEVYKQGLEIGNAS